jgi:histidinol-phosphatase
MTNRSDLRLALELADAADAVTLPLFRSDGLRVETKRDATPVSEADRAAEERIRQVLAQRRPADGIVGEEFGADGSGDRRWIIDPIDATVNYVRGVPVWGSLIALEEEDEVTVGVVSAPALGMRWWAARGEGAWGNAGRLGVSSVDDLAHAHLSFNSAKDLEAHGLAGNALSAACARTRGFGDFWSFMLLAAGAVDVVVEPIAAVWDLAPLIVIVEEAGGTLTDLSGERRIDGGNAVATNGVLHEAVLEVVRR